MEANGIVLSPDPRLRQECAVIEEITPAIEALAEKMKKMMFENGGCGLAAPQIGELIQLVTIDCDYSDKNDYDPYVLINPVIVEQSDHLVPFSEGCLSIPGISCEIERPDHVVVEAYDLDANLIRYEATGDLFCVCLQHEIDHLHGNTMFERLKPMQRIKAVKEYQDALARGARPGETEEVPPSPVLSAHISSRAQTFSLCCETARGTICGRSAPGTALSWLGSPGCRRAREGRLR